MNNDQLKDLLAQGDVSFWNHLAQRTRAATEFEDVFLLATLAKKAARRRMARPGKAGRLRLAILGGYSFHPFQVLLEHLLEMEGIPVELHVGEFENHTAEISDERSDLYQFQPQLVLLIPPARCCRYEGGLADPRAAQQAQVDGMVAGILGLCRTAHERTRAEIILGNFPLPYRHDLGSFRTRSLGSDWAFRKCVNLQLGLQAPPFVHVCDLEFLVNRRGGIAASDDRAWFESKQPGSPAFLLDLSREVAQIVRRLRSSPKKVLVLDLDNTLWGGIIGDDGLEGIELGDTSPRGEAFKAFQQYIKLLKARGVLLAVCSKNDHAVAAEAVEKHPEMVLRLADFVHFKVNWNPKPDNLRQMALDLNVGLDSFVFVDDNPAEIEAVRQFAPEVATILLGPDPAEYAGTLADCRCFEPQDITGDDLNRTSQYRANIEREALAHTAADMPAYLASLKMEAIISPFTPLDAPRIAQLINKSNQFNLSTRRRTEAEVRALIGDPGHVCFSVRLQDRFGDLGLIAVVIGELQGTTLDIDTWLMSCRVLKRQVEEEVLNELARQAHLKKCVRLRGIYLPTAKNNLVRGHYPQLGFRPLAETPERMEYELPVENYQPKKTAIHIVHRSYETS